jgi:hypothetical protein
MRKDATFGRSQPMEWLFGKAWVSQLEPRIPASTLAVRFSFILLRYPETDS